MTSYSTIVKERLLSIIQEMSQTRSLYVVNPKKDFTRKRKLSFEDMMQIIIAMGGDNIYKELLKATDYQPGTPTTSAFIQQRAKILPEAFEFLLREFNKTHETTNTFHGYDLYAVDGSDVLVPTNPKDADTFFKTSPGGTGFNMIHLNALYDLCNNLYVDAFVVPQRECGEREALINFLTRSPYKDKIILVADRGYEGYNCFAHIERKGWNYVVRVKDIHSQGILAGLDLPQDGEFDTRVDLILTKKQTKEVTDNPQIYKVLSGNKTFDFLDLHDNKFYPMSFRVIRFKLPDDSYTAVITNLFHFSTQQIIDIYKMRWGIETSFRKLKYTVGLVNFHAKTREFIIQEIFAKIIMYNFTEMITSHVVISKPNAKYCYKVNFSVAVLVCKQLLLLNNKPPPDVEALIQKNTVPIDKVRSKTATRRCSRSKSAVSFFYRVA